MWWKSTLAYANELAVRVEFFGDEIDRISEVNPLTGERKNVVRHVAIFPAVIILYLLKRCSRDFLVFGRKWNEQVKRFTEQGKLIEAQRIAQRTQYDMEMLAEVGMCKGIENYSAVLSGREPGKHPHHIAGLLSRGFFAVCG